LDITGRKWQEAGEDCIMRSFIICILYPVLLGSGIAKSVKYLGYRQAEQG
jgi:hypothetical protein